MISASSPSKPSFSQAATIATTLKAKRAVPRIFGEFLTSGIAVVDDTDDIFLKEASPATLYPLGHPTEIVRDAFLIAKPIVVGSPGKAALKAADVDKKQDSSLFTNPKDINTVPDAFWGLLKQSKFLGRCA